MNRKEHESRMAYLRRLWDTYDTEYLIEVWRKHNIHEWGEDVFAVIQEILQDRLGELPEQSLPSQPSRTSITSEPTAEAQRHLQTLDERRKAENLGNFESELVSAYQLSPAMQHLDKAVEHVCTDELENALQECDLAIGAMPGLAAAHNYRGMILEETGQLESAVRDYAEAVRLNPHFYAARTNLSNAKIKLEEEQYRLLFQSIPVEEGEESSAQFSEVEETTADLDSIQDVSVDEIQLVPPAPYLDEKAIVLRGWPGHRIRPGRSGYDPLDTDFELAHIEGVIIRLLLSGKLRTQNPFYLLGMIFTGIILCTCLLPVFAFPNMSLNNQLEWLLMFSPYWGIGISLLINVFLNLAEMMSGVEDNNLD